MLRFGGCPRSLAIISERARIYRLSSASKALIVGLSSSPRLSDVLEICDKAKRRELAEADEKEVDDGRLQEASDNKNDDQNAAESTDEVCHSLRVHLDH